LEVPKINKQEGEAAATKEDCWFLDEVDEALVVHPEDDHDADEEGDNVSDGVGSVLHRHGVGVGDDMENPGLVGDGIELSDKSQDRKSNSFTGDNCTSEAQDDGNVVNGEEGELAGDDHVHRLRDVDAEGEDDQVDCHR